MPPAIAIGRSIAAAIRPSSIRSLHMTGAATYASKLLTTAEHKPTSTPVRPAVDSSVSSSPFNTSRALKAVGDSSTIDFAFLPDLADLSGSAKGGQTPMIKLPKMPDQAWLAAASSTMVNAEPIRPQIYTVAADSDHVSSNSAISPVLPASGDVDLGASTSSVVGSAKAAISGFLDGVLGPKSSGSPSVA